ncbi:MAG: DUF3426 domain-containing protein [Azovibrio sp.]|uniref:DUF3426 domain-containing protein n=3 Tax=Azovibrio sp. TaxID=1872673 RepID=UPI003C760890
MLLTRCPACATTFRLTREQLLARNGKVRCGSCRQVFNASEHLLDESPSPAPAKIPPLEQAAAPLPIPEPDVPPQAPPPSPSPEALERPAAEPEPGSEAGERPPAATEAPPHTEAVAPPPLRPPFPPMDPLDAILERQKPASPEDIKQQGLETGLLAARDLTEIPGFSRWSAAPLEGLASAPTPRALWPFVLVSLLLILALALQAVFHFRGELSRQAPALGQLFSQLGLEIPLPRQAEWISIEASDLQVENGSGHLILLATLRNRAPYPQQWPALELTLTDTYDAVLVRKVFPPREYLPQDAASAFKPGDTPIRLDLDAQGMHPAGYRLYLFYP